MSLDTLRSVVYRMRMHGTAGQRQVKRWADEIEDAADVIAALPSSPVADSPTGELLPCPFCGRDAAERLEGDGQWTQVGCSACGAKGAEFMLNWPKAYAAWNSRSAPSPSAGAAKENETTKI